MIEFNITLLYQFANLIVVMILLNLFFFKPILAVLKRRRDGLQALSEKAESGKAEIEGMGKAYDDRLKEKKLPIVQLRDAQLKDTHGASMKVIEEARKELTEELAKVKDAVKKEAGKTLEALRGESARLSDEIVQKLVKRGA
jgi:F-type H+-transporting ATPase subunit b